MQVKKTAEDYTIVERIQLSQNTYLLRLSPTDHNPLPDMYPGQFVGVLPPGGHTLLRRPISICNMDHERGELWLLVANVGRGTFAITQASVGDRLNLILPLGNTFNIDKRHKPLLVGGGVGIAPMLYLARCFSERGIRPDVLLGGRHSDQIVLRECFEEVANVHITTEDGSLGLIGRVTDHPILTQGDTDIIYTCGPNPMMQAVAKIAHHRGLECEVSLENTMACGIGACLCCVEDTSDKGNVCVCTDGPVFNIKQLKWTLN